MIARSQKAYDRDAVSDETALRCPPEEDMTRQEFKDETDINTILRRFNISGELPQNVRMPTYGDFEGITSYHDAANVMRAAEESFNAMPAEIRERFGNDPAAFVEFCEQPENLEEARRMGLVPAAELADPTPAPGPAPEETPAP